MNLLAAVNDESIRIWTEIANLKQQVGYNLPGMLFIGVVAGVAIGLWVGYYLSRVKKEAPKWQKK